MSERMKEGRNFNHFLYTESERGVWTVGHYRPTDGKWVPESDHETAEDAAKRTALLNGATPVRNVGKETLKLAFVVADYAALAQLGGDVERNAYLADIPIELVPREIRRLLSDRPKFDATISVMLAKDRGEQ